MRGELECFAVAARDEHSPASLLLGRDGRSEEVVGLVAGGFADDEAAGANEIRQHVELVDQLVVELPAALISRQLLDAPGRQFERVPPDEDRAWRSVS